MTDIIEQAKSGRAKCRGCGQTIAKDTLRYGEVVDNPFGDGEATYWFHVDCAAYRRPEKFVAYEVLPDEVPHKDKLRAIAEQGVEHYRLARIKKLEQAPSGRAKCRQCKELIPKEAWRIALEIWEEARFSPIGFIHVGCGAEYFGTPDFLSRSLESTPDLDKKSVSEIKKLAKS